MDGKDSLRTEFSSHSIHSVPYHFTFPADGRYGRLGRLYREGISLGT